MRRVQFRKREKQFLSLCLATVIFSAVTVYSHPSADETFFGETGKTVICIDAGHGGETDGAEYVYDGVLIKEKDINLKIAMKLQEELLKYENVETVMTRTEDITMELRPRVQYAVDHNADYLISVHNNAPGNNDFILNGCMVLTTVSHYQAPTAKLPNIYEVSEKLGLAVVEKLQLLGLNIGTDLGAQLNNGIVRRPYSPEGYAKTTSYYPDGSVSDYYALIRFGAEMGLPAIIIEHAYLSNALDYRTYLETEESIAALARADAEGIAQALGLKRKQEEAYIPLSVLPYRMPPSVPKAVQDGAQNYRILRLGY